MPKIQSPQAVPTRAAPRLDASPPDEDGKLGVDNGSPRPSDLSPPPFFWSRAAVVHVLLITPTAGRW